MKNQELLNSLIKKTNEDKICWNVVLFASSSVIVGSGFGLLFTLFLKNKILASKKDLL
jgi:hypothetical protein